MLLQLENGRSRFSLVAAKTFEGCKPIMQGMRQDMDVRIRPIDERTIHPDFSLRFHSEADYSSGFEEASSKRAAFETWSAWVGWTQAKIGVDECGEAIGCMRRDLFDL